MEELFKRIASNVALGVEALAVVLVAFGAVEGALMTVRHIVPGTHAVVRRKEIWVRFAIWLMLGLEFELAADVIRTAIAPTWNDIGQLGAIAAIRTVLNYFLERDISEYAADKVSVA
jgi:uncharacterized membrane protein